MTQVLEHFQSSDLSRSSSKVFAAAEHAPIIVTRRDGEDLVLMSEQEATARQRLLEFAAQLIAVTLDDHGTLTERMADRFPWMLALSSKDQTDCAREIIEAARASFATGQAHLAMAEIAAWESTASAVAQGLHQVEIDWLAEPLLVEKPL